MTAKILKSDQNGLIKFEGWNKDQSALFGDSGSAIQRIDFSGVNMIIAITVAISETDSELISVAVNVTTHQKWIEDIALTEF